MRTSAQQCICQCEINFIWQRKESFRGISQWLVHMSISFWRTSPDFQVLKSLKSRCNRSAKFGVPQNSGKARANDGQCIVLIVWHLGTRGTTKNLVFQTLVLLESFTWQTIVEWGLIRRNTVIHPLTWPSPDQTGGNVLANDRKFVEEEADDLRQHPCEEERLWLLPGKQV